MEKITAFVKKWNGVSMQDDGAYVSKQFNTFQNAFKREISRICSNIGANLVKFSKGHYDMSGFIERDGHYVYFSYDNSCNAGGRAYANLRCRGTFFCRTAAHEKDYRGGYNNTIPFTDAEETFNRLLNAIHMAA